MHVKEDEVDARPGPLDLWLGFGSQVASEERNWFLPQ